MSSYFTYGATNKIFTHEATNAAYSLHRQRGSARLGSARRGTARRGAIACVYAKVLSKRRLSHRPFPEDIGIYSIILIRALSCTRGFCFLAAQWPDSLRATVRAFLEAGGEGGGKGGRWKERVARRETDRERGREGKRETERRTERERSRASWHVIPVTVIAVRYYSTANVIHLWFNERSRETAAVRLWEDADCSPTTVVLRRTVRGVLLDFSIGSRKCVSLE